MAASALNILSGLSAAVAGLAGEKVSKDGSVPGMDLAALVPALLGKSGGSSGILGTIASVASKTGLLNSSKLTELAGSLFTTGKTTAKTTSAAGGVAGLAAAIAGSTGSGSSLVSIASMASTLASSAKDSKGLVSIASELGKTLSSKNGISFSGGATAIKGLSSVLGGDIKGELFKAVLKGLSS